jgi:hypothetical protein
MPSEGIPVKWGDILGNGFLTRNDELSYSLNLAKQSQMKLKYLGLANLHLYALQTIVL